MLRRDRKARVGAHRVRKEERRYRHAEHKEALSLRERIFEHEPFGSEDLVLALILVASVVGIFGAYL